MDENYFLIIFFRYAFNWRQISNYIQTKNERATYRKFINLKGERREREERREKREKREKREERRESEVFAFFVFFVFFS